MEWIERDVVIKTNDNFTSNGARMEFVRRIGPALRLHLCSKLLSDTNSKMTVKNLTSSTNTPQCWYYCSVPSWGKKLLQRSKIEDRANSKYFSCQDLTTRSLSGIVCKSQTELTRPPTEDHWFLHVKITMARCIQAETFISFEHLRKSRNAMVRMAR